MFKTGSGWHKNSWAVLDGLYYEEFEIHYKLHDYFREEHGQLIHQGIRMCKFFF